ncbi:alpha/beta hydrolase [Deinococcus sonorensis]|uniref:Alpha/beta fold hydrolase n=2 Tax=Deinococcus sonorensis TaxID=309891 RepID=A0AAU7U7R8_9DEIO
MTKPAARNRRPSALQLALTGTGLGLAALLAVGWYFADGLVHVRPVRRPVWPTRIQRLEQQPDGSQHVTLTRTPTTLRPGIITLEWDSPAGIQRGQLGPVLSQTRVSVTRALRHADVPLTVGLTVRASTIGLGTPADRGMAQLDVTVPGEHGPMPAWLIPASGDTLAAASGTDWVIVTHGYGGLRQDALRILPTFQRLGLTSLTITYRNAEGAPRTPEKVHRLSAEEWQDLECAVQYAEQHGARRILLFGFSMGGSISLAFLRYSRLARRVTGVMLDSPALEWRSLIKHHAVRYRLPVVLARVVEWLTEFKAKQDFNAVDHLSVMDRFDTPILLMHGSIDKTVPVSQVETFAQARPDIVEYHRFEGAQHVRTWNMDPPRYEEAVERFVRRMLDVSGSGREPQAAPSNKENQNA